MRYELRLHHLLLSILVMLLSIFTLVVYFMGAKVADERFEAEASLAIVIAVAAVFAYIGTAEGIVALYFGIKHPRELASYLLLGLLSVSSGLYLAFVQSESLQRVALIVAPHAFLFGFAELRIAQSMYHHTKARRALIVCGCSELALGAALIWARRISNRDISTLLAFVSLMTILQLLPLLFYQRIEVLTAPETHET